jgi:hypothetical protein
LNREKLAALPICAALTFIKSSSPKYYLASLKLNLMSNSGKCLCQACAW